MGEVVYLDTVSNSGNKPWTADIKVNETTILFKIDSGADVTVIPLTVYQRSNLQPTLKSTSKVLMGPCNYKMNCIGTFTTQLRHEDKTTTEEIFVVKGLERSYLVDTPTTVVRRNRVQLRNIPIDTNEKQDEQQTVPSLNISSRPRRIKTLSLKARENLGLE